MLAEIATQRTRARGEHDVVHRGRVGVLDALDVGKGTLPSATARRLVTRPLAVCVERWAARTPVRVEGAPNARRAPRPAVRAICCATRSGCTGIEIAASASRARAGGKRSGRRLWLGGAARKRAVVGVEQSAQQRRAAYSVDGGVMDLRHEREAAPREALHDVHLPERPVARQRLLRDPRDEIEQRGLVAGCGQRRAVQMGVEVEVRVSIQRGWPSPSGTAASFRRRIGSAPSRRSICARTRRKSSRGPRPCDSSTSAPITFSGTLPDSA